MTDTSISEFHTSFYILERKIGISFTTCMNYRTCYCGNKCHETFRHCGSFQNVLCNCDYTEQVVASLEHQIQSKCYDGNIFVSIEGIDLNHFSDPKHTLPLLQHNHAHIMLCFTPFFVMTEKRMLPPQLHKEKIIELLNN